MQFQKHFSVAEARALLPELRRIFQDVHRRRHLVRRADEQLGHKLTESKCDIGGPTVNGMLWDWSQMNQQLQRIQQQGVMIKDFERGLVDFPHVRDGREVFLCWKLSENDIAFWHDIDAGYAGRKKL